MKKTIKYLLTAIATFAASYASAECNINLAIVPSEQTEDVPENIISYLVTRLEQVSTAFGVTADPGLGQFFISAKFSHVLEEVLPGPPQQFALHTMLTLYIGDLNSKTIYATYPIDLRGVGISSQRAFINALRSLNGNNAALASFVDKGKKKIVDYYDKNYPQIIEQARKSAMQHNYDEALWRLSNIPECSVGYNDAVRYINQYFQAYIDQSGLSMLNAAQAAWAAHPDAQGAEAALGFLLGIDPESSAYPRAQALINEIKASVKSDRDFELRKKYQDGIDLQKQRIDAAREVGVAFGKGQQPTTTYINWIR